MTQRFSAFILYRLLGWKIDGVIPHELSKLLIILLPHTSNWDFVFGMLYVKAENINATVFGKDGFYFFPFTYCYKYFNIVPIERRKKSNFVAQAAALYIETDSLWTAMAPEGTRSKVDNLKSGYYHFAKAADVPLLIVALDFDKKALVVREPRKVKPSFAEDEADLLAFSRSIAAKRRNLAV